MKAFIVKQLSLRILRSIRDVALYAVAPNHLPRPSLKSLQRVRDLDSGRPGQYDNESPIFLLATGWRTGSTLVQRILMTHPNTIIWGEPYGTMGIIPRISEMFGAFDLELVGPGVVLDSYRAELYKEWIANLFPEISSLRLAFQAMLYNWLAVPAKRNGYENWGLKEVRLDFLDGYLLNWIFPKAKFIVLTRDPVKAYQSAMGMGSLWGRWPDSPINSPYAFGKHWSSTVLSWTQAPADFPYLFLRYEEIRSGGCEGSLDEINRFIGIDIKPEVALKNIVGSTANKPIKLTTFDRMAVRTGARKGIIHMNY